MTPPEDTNPIPPDPKDVKKTTEELKNQKKATDDLAKSTEAAADATSKLGDASKKAVDSGKEEVKLTKEQIEQKKKLADIAAKAKADKKEAIEAGKTQAEIAKSFEKISFVGIFRARIAMKGFLKSLKSMDGMKIDTKIEGIGDLGEAFSKLSSQSFFGARRAKRGLMILGGALVDMQKMSEGPLEVTTAGLDGMGKMVESMGNMGYFAGRRMKKFLKTFIGYLSPFMHDIAKLETGPALDPIFTLIDAFSKFADKGRKANKAVKILAKSIGTLMGMKIKPTKPKKGGIGAEEEEREKLRLEEERNQQLIDAITGISAKKEGKKKGNLFSGILSIFTGIYGLISKIVLMKGAIGGVLKSVTGIFGSKNKVMAKTAKKTTGIFEGVINSIKKLIGDFINIVKKVVNSVGDILKKIVDTVVKAFKKIGKGIASVIQSLLEGLGKGLSAIGNPKALIGALALLIVAAGIFVLSKAFVEFTKVNFKTLAIGIIAIVTLTAVMMGLGMMMASGFGAVALLLGAAAMLIIAGAALVLGIAFQALGEGLTLILGSLGSFLNEILPGFLQMANPAVGAGLILAAAGIVVLTAAIVGFMAVLTLAGAAGAAGGIVSGVLGSVSSFFGGPGPPPGPFEMLDKFIGFAEAAPFLQKGADAIGVIGSALSTFLTMNFAAVGAELGQLAMILLSFDAVSLGMGGAAGAAIGFLSFGLIKAKSPLDILKELVKLAPDVKKLGDGIHSLAKGMEVLAGIDGSAITSSLPTALPTADSMGKVVSSTSGISKRDKMLEKFKQERSELMSEMKDDEEFFGSSGGPGRTKDRARIRELNARISKIERQSPKTTAATTAAAAAVGDIGKSSKHKQDLSRFQTTTNASELTRLQGVRAKIAEKGPVSGSRRAKRSYERKLDMIDKSIGQLNAKISSGGYAAGGQMDASTKRLRESQARNNQQAMTPRYQEVNTMQVNQTQQYLGGMTARSPGVADDDDL